MKTGEHKKYKKIYEKYASSIYSVKGERAEKVTGKRDYDKDPEGYYLQLNGMIIALNSEIKNKIYDQGFDGVFGVWHALRKVVEYGHNLGY